VTQKKMQARMRELKTADFQFHFRMMEPHGSRIIRIRTRAAVSKTGAATSVLVVNVTTIKARRLLLVTTV
jgi:hypothetical protein